jgi:hypothetical protein
MQYKPKPWPEDHSELGDNERAAIMKTYIDHDTAIQVDGYFGEWRRGIVISVVTMKYASPIVVLRDKHGEDHGISVSEITDVR